MALLREYKQRGLQKNQPRFICFTTANATEAKRVADKVIYLREDRVSDVKRDLVDSPSEPSDDIRSNRDSTFIDVSQNELVVEYPRAPKKGMSDETLQKSSLGAIVSGAEPSSDQPFEMAQELASQSSTRVYAHELSAIFTQRYQQARGSAKTWLFQLLGPVCVIVLGYFACRTFITVRTPSRQFSPTYYSTVQQIMLNDEPVFRAGSNILASQVAANLDHQDRFEFVYSDASDSGDFYRYHRSVYEKDMRAEHSNYGSYLFYQLDKSQ